MNEKAVTENLKRILDGSFREISNGNPRVGINLLIDQLNMLIENLSGREVKSILQPIAVKHPIAELVYQCPYTDRSSRKPRGYSGDAELIDFIYGIAAPGCETSALGAEIFAQCMATPSCSSVRHRRAFIGKYLDDLATIAVRPLKVLSLACGHLREGLSSSAVKQGDVHVLGFDQDRLSLETAERDCDSRSTTFEYGSVRQAIRGSLSYDRFDLVYSTGLYDYLNAATARRLTARLFDMLVPGGKLLIANFLPGNRERGYMEIFMDWYLTYRPVSELVDCADEIDGQRITNRRLFYDPERYVAYLEITG